MILTGSDTDSAEVDGLRVKVVPDDSTASMRELPSYDEAVTHSLGPSSHEQARQQGLSSPHPPEQRLSQQRSSAAGPSSSSTAVKSGQSSPTLPPKHRGPFACVFKQASPHSMILRNREDATPYYYISVHMNCFIPSSHVTVIYRGDNSDGSLIGSFEMGISRKKSTVSMNGRERLTSSVLRQASSNSVALWRWQWHADPRLHLSWHCDSPVRYCYLTKQEGTPDATLLASYTPQSLTPRADGQMSSPFSLKLFPDGQRHFDDIVISALILERKRLTPDQRDLFN